MTPARLSCTVSKVSAECLTQAVGFLMGLFSQRLACQRLFFALTFTAQLAFNSEFLGRQIHGRVVY